MHQAGAEPLVTHDQGRGGGQAPFRCTIRYIKEETDIDYEKAITVAAGQDRVWEVLSDIERWPERITTYEEVRRLDDGALRVGSRARVKQKGLAAGDWEVSELDEGTRFTWASRQPGVHIVGRHTVSSDPDGSTRLTLVVEQTGWMSGLVSLLLGRKIRSYVDLEAAGLKAAAEAA